MRSRFELCSDYLVIYHEPHVLHHLFIMLPIDFLLADDRVYRLLEVVALAVLQLPLDLSYQQVCYFHRALHMVSM